MERLNHICPLRWRGSDTDDASLCIGTRRMWSVRIIGEDCDKAACGLVVRELPVNADSTWNSIKVLGG